MLEGFGRDLGAQVEDFPGNGPGGLGIGIGLAQHGLVFGVLAEEVLALLERIPEHVRILVRLASAALMLSVAAFGMLAPWAICRSPPYGTRMCTPDDDDRRELQRWRLKTAAWLAVVAAVLLALPASPLRDTYRFIKRTAGRMLV